MSPTGRVYNEYSTGPTTEPFGKTNFEMVGSESLPAISTWLD